MKEPTGDIEAEIESYKRQIRKQEEDIAEYRLELELANRTITHLEGMIEQYRYQAFVNQRNVDDWK